MEDFAFNRNVLVVSNTQAMVKGFVEDFGGSEDSGSFSHKIISTHLPLDPRGK